MRYFAVFVAMLQTACVSAGSLDSEHQEINQKIRSIQSFIGKAEKFLLSTESHLSEHQKELLTQSSASSGAVIQLDCELLTLDDPTSDLEGSEHQFQIDACILSELKQRQDRMKLFVCPESYFEGHPPDCEELRRLEQHPPTRSE